MVKPWIVPVSFLEREGATMKLDFNFDKKREFEVTDGKYVQFRLRDIAVEPGKKVSLRKDYDPDFTGGFKDKSDALERLGDNTARMSELQEVLYAQDTFSILMIFQAMDAAGKDGVIRHVMSGVNPQGCHVTSFKAPPPKNSTMTSCGAPIRPFRAAA